MKAKAAAGTTGKTLVEKLNAAVEKAGKAQQAAIEAGKAARATVEPAPNPAPPAKGK